MRAGRRRDRSAVLALLVSVLVVAGCGFGGGSESIDRNRLIDDAIAQLDRATDHHYHAVYLLAGGKQGSIAQSADPPRTAMTYPSGWLLLDDNARTTCITATRPARCRVYDPPTEGTSGEQIPAKDDAGYEIDPIFILYQDVTKRGLVGPAQVLDLLRAASLQPKAKVRQTDTTIAGRQATCLAVTGLSNTPASSFNACVTVDGELASFSGIVDGVAVDQALIEITDVTSKGMFVVPKGADVVDKRHH